MKLRILGQMGFADTEALTPNRTRCQDFARFVPVFSAAVAADATVSEHMWVTIANGLNGLHGLGRRRFCRNTIQPRWAPKADGGIATRNSSSPKGDQTPCWVWVVGKAIFSATLAKTALQPKL